jgi:hypothetical protein
MATVKGEWGTLLKIWSFLASQVFQHKYLGIAYQILCQIDLLCISWGYLAFQEE